MTRIPIVNDLTVFGEKHLDPSVYGVDLSDHEEVQIWREMLQVGLFDKRGGWVCECCGWRLNSYLLDLHEGIVSRGDVQGWSFEKKGLIFHEYNCFNLCRDCHKEHKLSREDAWKLSCEQYGEEKVREWYEGLPWKAGVPRRFWDAD